MTVLKSLFILSLYISCSNSTIDHISGYYLTSHHRGENCTGAIFKEVLQQFGQCEITYDQYQNPIGSRQTGLYDEIFGQYGCVRHFADSNSSATASDDFYGSNSTDSYMYSDPELEPPSLRSLSETTFDYWAVYTMKYTEVLNCNGTSSVEYSKPLNCTSVLYADCKNYRATGTSYITRVVDSLTKKPQFNIKGLITSHYSTAGECAAAKNSTYQEVYALDECIPVQNVGRAKEWTSIRNSFNFLSSSVKMVQYPDSVDCSGRVLNDMTHLVLLNQCGYINEGQLRYLSRQNTATRGAWLSELLENLNTWWIMRTTIAALSCIAGIAMLSILLRERKKWTIYKRLIFVICFTQLMVDATFLADPYSDRFQLYEVPSRDLGRIDLVLFFRYSFTTATCLTSNFMMYIVFYTIQYTRSFTLSSTKRRLVMGCIFITSLGPALAQYLTSYFALNYGLSLGISYKQHDINYEIASRVTMYTIIASVTTNVLLFSVVIFALSCTGRGIFSSTLLIRELTNRIIVYPLIQILTQVPASWETLIYLSNPDLAKDDAWYKTKDYIACWYLYSLLVPSAGLLFSIAFMSTDPPTRMAIMKLVPFTHGTSANITTSSKKSTMPLPPRIMATMAQDTHMPADEIYSSRWSVELVQQNVPDHIPMNQPQGVASHTDVLALSEYDDHELSKLLDAERARCLGLTVSPMLEQSPSSLSQSGYRENPFVSIKSSSVSVPSRL